MRRYWLWGAVDRNPDGPTWQIVLGKLKLPRKWSVWVAREWR